MVKVILVVRVDNGRGERIRTTQSRRRRWRVDSPEKRNFSCSGYPEFCIDSASSWVYIPFKGVSKVWCTSTGVGASVSDEVR